MTAQLRFAVTVLLALAIVFLQPDCEPPAAAAPPAANAAPATQAEAIAPERLAQLLVAIRGDDPPAVREAVNELGQAGPAAAPAIPALMALLDREDPGYRTIGAWALGRIGPAAKDAVPALVKALGEKPSDAYDSFEARQAAAQALGRIGVGNKEVVSALTGLLDPDNGLSSAALDALGALGPQAADAVDIIRKKIAAGRYRSKRFAENALLRITGQGGKDPDLVNAFIDKRAAYFFRVTTPAKGFVGEVYDPNGRRLTWARPSNWNIPSNLNNNGQWLEVDGVVREKWIQWPIRKDYTGSVAQMPFQKVYDIKIQSAKPIAPVKVVDQERQISFRATQEQVKDGKWAVVLQQHDRLPDEWVMLMSVGPYPREPQGQSGAMPADTFDLDLMGTILPDARIRIEAWPANYPGNPGLRLEALQQDVPDGGSATMTFEHAGRKFRLTFEAKIVDPASPEAGGLPKPAGSGENSGARPASPPATQPSAAPSPALDRNAK